MGWRRIGSHGIQMAKWAGLRPWSGNVAWVVADVVRAVAWRLHLVWQVAAHRHAWAAARCLGEGKAVGSGWWQVWPQLSVAGSVQNCLQRLLGARQHQHAREPLAEQVGAEQEEGSRQEPGGAMGLGLARPCHVHSILRPCDEILCANSQ